jgi:arginine exporter protein ArgO
MAAGAVEMVLAKSIYSKIYMWQGAAWLVWYLYATWKTAPAEDSVVAG